MDAARENEFREYVSARQAALYRVAYLLTGHHQDAEDLLQAALAKLALPLERAGRSGATDAYVRKIIYHQQVSWGRTRWRKVERVTAEPPEPRVATDPADTSTTRLALDRLLRRLTKRQRALLVLRYYEDLPESQVAEILGCSVGAMRSQTYRTLARLRELEPDLFSILETA